MPDLFDNPDQNTAHSAATATKKQPRSFAGMSAKELIVLVAAIAIFMWGAWVTKNLVAENDSNGELVQLQLQAIIGEYLQAQARSASDEQTAARETAAFMATLDKTVEDLSADGKVVLVHEAIIGGDIPDITEEVKAAVYSKVPRPQIAQATLDVQQSQAARVQGEMQAFMASNGGADVN